MATLKMISRVGIAHLKDSMVGSAHPTVSTEAHPTQGQLAAIALPARAGFWYEAAPIISSPLARRLLSSHLTALGRSQTTPEQQAAAARSTSSCHGPQAVPGGKNMKRLLLRISAVGILVVLGVIAVEHAQRGSERSKSSDPMVAPATAAASENAAPTALTPANSGATPGPLAGTSITGLQDAMPLPTPGTSAAPMALPPSANAAPMALPAAPPTARTSAGTMAGSASPAESTPAADNPLRSPVNPFATWPQGQATPSSPPSEAGRHSSKASSDTRPEASRGTQGAAPVSFPALPAAPSAAESANNVRTVSVTPTDPFRDSAETRRAAGIAARQADLVPVAGMNAGYPRGCGESAAPGRRTARRSFSNRGRGAGSLRRPATSDPGRQSLRRPCQARCGFRQSRWVALRAGQRSRRARPAGHRSQLDRFPDAEAFGHGRPAAVGAARRIARRARRLRAARGPWPAGPQAA